jgi:hypothetical protein
VITVTEEAAEILDGRAPEADSDGGDGVRFGLAAPSR